MQQHSRSLWIIFAILLVDTMGFGIVIPVLPMLVEHTVSYTHLTLPTILLV